jgi:predicted acyl esterase
MHFKFGFSFQIFTLLAAILSILNITAKAAPTAGDGSSIIKGGLKIYGNDNYPVWYRKAGGLDSLRVRYLGFKPSTTILKKGSIRRPGAKPLDCDIVFERDVALKLRDGTTIYTDVFRPVDSDVHKVPSIVAWSPYGKIYGGQWLDDIPGRVGVPLSDVSELQKFEGPDPAYWVNKGYAILNPDARGAYFSEGNITFFGRQLAEDGYDFIEWAGVQPWSNGKVGMSGNSWLAISQWFIAAENPPHLAAIAPWEGLQDLYREAARLGGFASVGFSESIIQSFAGRNYIEDQARMQVGSDMMNDYWRDKRAKVDQIKMPIYAVASYNSPIHTMGTFGAFKRAGSKEKWLRVHDEVEWSDYYAPQSVEDLRLFFDRYLKGINNGWESTPKVRLNVVDGGSETGQNRILHPEEDWPLPNTQPKALYLKTDKTLALEKVEAPTNISYLSTSLLNGGVTLTYIVPNDFTLSGNVKLKLWMEAQGSNDIEIFCTLSKRNPRGYPIITSSFRAPIPFWSTAQMRLSHRELDASKSTQYEPFHTHENEQLLKPGEIVPVEIGLTPIVMKFRAGEQLVLGISALTEPSIINLVTGTSPFGGASVAIPKDGGTYMPGTKVPMTEMGGGRYSKYVYSQGVSQPAPRSKGTHVIHIGGQYDSHVLFPSRS